MGRKIKLLAMSRNTESGTWAMVAPMLVDADNLLYNVNGVLNAVYVHGNAVGDVYFYGSGAGSLPTASAVSSDIISCARHLRKTMRSDWTSEPMKMISSEDVKFRYFVRFNGTEEEAGAVFGEIEPIRVCEAEGEFGFMTGEYCRKDFVEKAERSGHVIKAIRRA